jgi:hypothetical protein
MVKQKPVIIEEQQQEESQALVTQSGGLGFGEVFAKRRPRELKLIQRTNADPANGLVQGMLYDELTNTAYESMQAVFLDIHAQRAYYESTVFTKGALPKCKSVNGIVPLQPSERFPTLVPQAANCKVCAKSKWGASIPGAKSKPPACPIDYRITFIDGHTQLPYVTTVKGRSVKHAEKLLLVLRDLRDLSLRNDKLDLSLFDFTAEIKAVEENNNGLQTYVLKFDKAMRVLNPGSFGPFYEEYIASRNQEDQEEERAEQAQRDIDREFAEV